MKGLRNAAVEAADRGWYVIPLRRGGKQPITEHGIHDATNDLAVTLTAWRSNPRANVGVVCNASDLVVIDVDPRHGGDETLADAEATLGRLPPTVEAETGGGGWHYFFKHPGCSLRGKLGPGLDLKDHGYVLIEPSLHPSGRKYAWSVDGHPDEVELAELPAKWLNIATIVTSRRSSAASRDPQGSDPLRRLSAEEYIHALTGREVNRHGFVACPFHGDGDERTPSLKVEDNVWACYACEPVPGKRCLGGNVYDFAALLWGYAIPLRGIDYLEVKERLKGELL